MLDARTAALAAGYSTRHAKAVGEKFSDILEGLEDDILRILTRTLITELLAAGIQGGLAGDETSAGGLEGLFNTIFGAGAGIFGEDEAEQPTITRVSSEVAEDTTQEATAALLGLGEAGDVAGGLLSGALSDGALKAGVETLTQATASTVATTQLGELAIAAGAAAAALQTMVAAAGPGGGAGGSGGGILGTIASLGLNFIAPGLGSAVNTVGGPGSFGGGNPLEAGFSGNPHFAHGGPVGGPGSGRSDSIPALLSNGEFVVSAEAARGHRRLLEMINAGITPPAFATGGRAAPFMRFVGGDFTPSRPTGGSEARRGGGEGGTNVTLVLQGVQDADSFRQNLPQIRGALAEMMDEAMRRDN